MTVQSKFSKYLRERRQELGLTMEELAILVYDNKTMRSQISLYENDKKSPTLETLDKILQALNSEVIFKRKN